MPHSKPSTAKLVTAFAAVYLIWGSTYLAMRYAIQTIPPLLMASARYLTAGSLLYGWSRFKGTPAGTARSWRQAFALGAMFLLCGNGCVVLAEQWVPSGLTALLVGMVPMWVAVLGWIRPGGKRPSGRSTAGIVLGLFGLSLLIGVGNLRGGGTVDPTGAAILVLSSLAWATGSLYSHKTHISDSPLQASGMQMLGGGTLLLLVGLAVGEGAQFKLSAVSIHSAVALAYLAFAGAVVGFTAYSWLLKNTTPSRAATYAYVNPAVAVVLGWAIAGEALTARMMVSMCVIVVAVMVITTDRRQPV